MDVNAVQDTKNRAPSWPELHENAVRQLPVVIKAKVFHRFFVAKDNIMQESFSIKLICDYL